MARIVGTPNDDRLFGTVEDDRIFGGRGDDRIFGGRGDDVLAGGRDNDLLAGGRGDDRIFGGPGNDRIFGGPGNDDLRGGLGNDDLRGGLGNDRILGNAGDDRLFGNAGDDVLAGGLGNDFIVGGLGNDRIFGGPGDDVLTGGPGADRFVYGSLNHALDRITDFNPDDGDTLVLGGALRDAEEVRVQDGDDTVVAVQNDAGSFTELARLENFVEPGNDGPIDVWYGGLQTFGDPGVPQRWVNILGNVETDGLNSLTYSLNGGQPQPLAFPTTSGNFSRLANEGDFNVELDFDQLDSSDSHDLVTIRAAFDDGDVFTRDVLIDYEGGQTWPTDYSIDWSQVDDIQDAMQVVDGLWRFDDNGVRPVETGYDRLLVLGDETWDSYEVRLSVQMHDLTDDAVLGEAMWFGMQWGGHTDDPIPGQIPHAGYIPGATFMIQPDVVVLRPSEFEEDRIAENPRVGRGFQFQEGESYEFLIRNERTVADDDPSGGIDRTYGIKVWETGAQEPEEFWIQQTMIDQEPLGSFYLNAHFVDVTFGDIEVREIDPEPLLVSDVLQGEDTLEPLFAADAESSNTQATGGGGSSEGAGPTVALSDLLVTDETAVAA